MKYNVTYILFGLFMLAVLALAENLFSWKTNSVFVTTFGTALGSALAIFGAVLLSRKETATAIAMQNGQLLAQRLEIIVELFSTAAKRDAINDEFGDLSEQYGAEARWIWMEDKRTGEVLHYISMCRRSLLSYGENDEKELRASLYSARSAIMNHIKTIRATGDLSQLNQELWELVSPYAASIDFLNKEAEENHQLAVKAWQEEAARQAT